MSAMKLIEQARAKGNTIDSFISFCGGLPAPEFAQGVLGYKFSYVLPFFRHSRFRFCAEKDARDRILVSRNEMLTSGCKQMVTKRSSHRRAQSSNLPSLLPRAQHPLHLAPQLLLPQHPNPPRLLIRRNPKSRFDLLSPGVRARGGFTEHFERDVEVSWICKDCRGDAEDWVAGFSGDGARVGEVEFVRRCLFGESCRQED